jgi:hypothetical protein
MRARSDNVFRGAGELICRVLRVLIEDSSEEPFNELPCPAMLL